jgi:hypothetical protein
MWTGHSFRSVPLRTSCPTGTQSIRRPPVCRERARTIRCWRAWIRGWGRGWRRWRATWCGPRPGLIRRTNVSRLGWHCRGCRWCAGASRPHRTSGSACTGRPAPSAWADGRPFAWVDDEITDADRAWVSEHHHDQALLHQVDPCQGLTDTDFVILDTWLRATGGSCHGAGRPHPTPTSAPRPSGVDRPGPPLHGTDAAHH